MLMNPWCTHDEFGNFLTFRNGLITYMPAGRNQQLNVDGTWRRDGRQEGRPGRIARKFLMEEFLRQLNDKDFEVFSNALKAQDVSSYGKFMLVSGEDIRYWYNGRNYKDRQGSLTSSCMRYDNCSGYLDLYVENQDLINMLCLVDPSDERLLARALVWNTEQGTVLDRIYGSDVSVEAFRDYATNQGWLRRERNSYEQPTHFLDADENPIRFRATLALDKWRFNYYPYMDTFKYLDTTSGSLTNSSRRSHDAILEGTGGRYHPA